MATKEELLEKAKELDIEGRSSMNKEELEKAVAEAESQDSSLGHDSEASDEDNPEVTENLSPSGQEALEEMEPEQAKEADLALDASGPLHLQSPSDRIMTGAVSEEHAKEQEELLKDKPEEAHGDVTEAGDFADPNAKLGSKKDNLSENDDRELYEVRQEDVIDFPPAHQGDSDQILEQQAVDGAPLATTTVAGGDGRVFAQKSVFYTDGLGGPAEQNLERAYEIPELLQSNNPEVREAGDESLSEAAKDEKSDEEANEAERVKGRDDDPSETSRNSE